jgi:hypothetical protein
MSRTIRRRVEALEKSFSRSPVIFDDDARAVFIQKLVLAYHLGELKIDDDPSDRFNRALNYRNHGYLFTDLLFNVKRYQDALRRLFA